jgi:hypothetical protein
MIRTSFIALTLTFALACGINSVSKRQLEEVKAGDVITYRYQKGGKSWFYADKVTRVDAEKVYYHPSNRESTAGNDGRLQSFDMDRELSIARDELLKFETEQGEDRKVVIWIN